ncbi:hypothetical protein QA641_32585 [Bradyrhizobium sp. CB1650]|uniref:hypothetical protein n=1 Tax=Bradyrhizobium sp. CB1650 TaxID=3039153 RepID=UPI002434951D|nr:hypothetical protein [Bradyrhizobium sp. CB1650]WGD50305.1 hypothetical protein QA641_32585 [Bradyrhizobium sp. CB1650]
MHYEQADAKALTPFGIEARKSLKNVREFVARNSSASIIHVDPDRRAVVPAADENATSRLRVLDCVADQIAQRSTEEQVVTQNRSITWNYPHAYALGQYRMSVLAPSLPQDVSDTDRP